MLRTSLAALCAVLAVSVAACGGGGSGSSVTPSTALAGTTTLNPGATTTLTVPTVGGITSALGVSGSGTITAAQSVSLPSGLQSIATAAVSRGLRRADSSAPNVAVVYIAIGAATAVTLNSWPSITLTQSSAPSGNYYEAEWTGTKWVNVPNSGAGTISGNSVTFPAQPANPPITLAASSVLYLGVYTGTPLATPSPSPGASPTPTARPSASPTASPSASPTTHPSTSPGASPTPFASPASLALTQAGGASFTIVDTGYTGTFTVVSSNTSAVTIPNSPVGATGTDTTIPITAVGDGAATVTVTDLLNRTVVVPVTVVLPLGASSSSLNLTGIGASSFTVSEAGYTGSFTVTTSNASAVTTASSVTATGNTTTINIDAIANGVSNITVKDSNNQSVVVQVTVGLPVLSYTGGTFSPNAFGTSGNTFTVTQPGYSGTYTVTSSNTSAVTIPTSPVTAGSGSTTITIDAVANGSSNVTVKDSNNQSVVVPVTVSIPALTDSGSTLGVTTAGAASFTVFQTGYSGSYTVTSSNTNAVTVSTPIAAGSGSTTIGVDALSSGSANITVADSHGQSVVVAVTVTLPGLTASPTSLTLVQTGATSFTVFESNYSGTYTVTSSNTSVVTIPTSPVTAGGGSTVININAVGAGTANVTVTDSNSTSVVVPVGVTTTPITIQTHGKPPHHGGAQ